MQRTARTFAAQVLEVRQALAEPSAFAMQAHRLITFFACGACFVSHRGFISRDASAVD